MRSLAEVRRVSLETQLVEDVSISGDPSRMRELVSVLLDNAVKYADAGDRVEISVRKEHKRAIIRVSDNGPGIPAHALPHVFDRFYRVDKARSRESGGTGLGLAIARHIVDAHGGTIGVESTVGEGTVVTVELPA
jgi:two-component system phosphate regulon sensor histidine kinase PhoR